MDDQDTMFWEKYQCWCIIFYMDFLSLQSIIFRMFCVVFGKPGRFWLSGLLQLMRVFSVISI